MDEIQIQHAGRGFGKASGVTVDEAAEWAKTHRPELPRKLNGLDPETLAAVRASNETLRRGLPGDGTPKTAKEAKAHCPHRRLHREPIGVPSMPWTITYMASPVGAGKHVCIGGWLL